MDRITQACCMDVLLGLPKDARRCLARFFKNRRCGVAVVAERIPFSFRLLRRRHFLKTKDDEILLLLLVDLAKRYEGKILSLHAGTPDMEVFILKNEEALAPFYRILPKGERYDS